MDVCGKLPVYVPDSISARLESELNKKAEVVGLSEAKELGNGLYSTGEMKNSIGEQSLVVKGQKGNAVICGCSHPGLEHILNQARQFGEIYGVIGGFHGFNNLDALKGIKLIIPCHCTQHKQEIFNRFSDACVKGGAGRVLDI